MTKAANWTGQAAAAARRYPNRHRPEHRKSSENAEPEEDRQNARHRDDRRRRRGSRGRRPLPADRELRPDRGAEHEERRSGAHDRPEARFRLNRAAQAQTHERSVPGDIACARPRARPLHDVLDQQLGELVAVPLAPGARIPAQKPRSASLSPGHAVPHFAASRESPTSATCRSRARCSRSAAAPAAVSL